MGEKRSVLDRLDAVAYLPFRVPCRWVAARWDPVRVAGRVFAVSVVTHLLNAALDGPGWFLLFLALTPFSFVFHGMCVGQVRSTPAGFLPMVDSFCRWLRVASSFLFVLGAAGGLLVDWGGAEGVLGTVYVGLVGFWGYLLTEPRRPHPGRVRDRARAWVDRWVPVPLPTGLGV